MIGIYKITSPSGRVYIGQSVNIEKRLLSYKMLRCKGQRRLYNSLNKYGFDAHVFEVIEECAEELLTEREGYWQDFYDCVNKGLNCRRVSTTDKTGYDSEETKLKRSLSQKGVSRPSTKKGIKMSEESKQKMRGRREKVSGGNNPKAKPVVNIINNIIYQTLKEAAEKENIPYSRLQKILAGNMKNNTNLRYLKEEHIKSDMNVVIYGASKVVLDIETGVFFYSAKEAAEIYGITHSYLKSMLNGGAKNKTNLIYV